MTRKAETVGNLLISAFLAPLMIGLLSGCGRQDTAPAPFLVAQAQTNPIPGYVPTACPPGYGTISGGPCVPLSDFSTMCTESGGTVTQIFGPSVCRLTRQRWVSLPFMAVLNPGDPSGPWSYDTGINLRKGYKLSYTGSGSWGYQTATPSKLLGISFTTYSWNCSMFDFAGVSKGATVTNTDGTIPGLYGSDGTEAFFLGNSLAGKRIANDGILRIGLNADPSSQQGCYLSNGLTFTITACEDANHVSYACP